MFLAEILHTISSYQWLQKCARDFLLFRLDVELFAKIKNVPGFYTLIETRIFTFQLITQDLNKIKKIPNTHL